MKLPKASEYGYHPVPQAELDRLANDIRRRTDLLDFDVLMSRYRKAGLAPDPDPFSPALADAALAALAARRGFCMMRMGDAEMCFLLPILPGIPNLAFAAFERSVLMYQDRFRVSRAWHKRLDARMEAAVAEADALGVRGLWRPQPQDKSEIAAVLLDRLNGNPRGMSGIWRGTTDILARAERGALDGKIICSAHIYFGLLSDLERLIAAAPRTHCLTSSAIAVARLRTAFSDAEITHIPLRDTPIPVDSLPDAPDFLDQTDARLPADLTGELVLIGAGAWANFYAVTVKRRGGVALDIGSAFDLLAGHLTRPIHRKLAEQGILRLDDLPGAD